ncbi:alpha/beta hydrolase family protein [Phaeodactylibacter luteus]|uniref:Alpha/beta fold hydrolase n=1 Tax=Phaeodactylibacter luteus TaxID=1564516 RepID=A0A5C6RHF3_9BACT|nr:alpha/beta fold hydrolase [Phaeodactylibacter luteus]TXB61577.1 alpha/beta fold hydrolase [Phaeodactylibacter luteus]
MLQAKNLQLTGAAGRPFLLDLFFRPDGQRKPIVLFAHGFKGFKDWGHWHLIGQQFARAGMVFLPFNFSHNGTTLARPAEFADLDAFGQNNYSKELADLRAVLAWLHHGPAELPAHEADLSRIYLIGHSRGGAIASIFAHEDARIGRLALWASVSRLDYAWQGEGFIAQWAAQGQYEVVNGRTGQSMPIYYQMYRDFKANEERFSVGRALQQFNRPLLIVHGTADPAVPVEAAHALYRAKNDAELQLIEGADHVFGGSHPYEQQELPLHSQLLASHTLRFFGQP